MQLMEYDRRTRCRPRMLSNSASSTTGPQREPLNNTSSGTQPPCGLSLP
uniref:Uncharacterized protein LOC101306247 isoform X1 n=1 Tax=Rhizophora mucronata TaxID=61149 RepID=A0A2P2N4C0_RHIMU